METSSGNYEYGSIGNGRSATPRPGYQYEEFFGGTLPCPSCRGTGRIPRESENELVALIPFSDKRLKPRRTYLFVLIAVLLCVLVAGLLIFFLYPRNIEVTIYHKNLIPSALYINKTESVVRMTVTVRYNISNGNFFPMEVRNLTGKVFFDQRIMSQASNTTILSVPMRAKQYHYLTFNVTFDQTEGYIAYYCSDTFDHTLLMPFDVTMVADIMGRSEQITMTSYNHVQCSPKLIPTTTTTTKKTTVTTTAITTKSLTLPP